MKDIEWAEGMNCAVTVCDAEGMITYMNARARETYKKHGDLIGKNLFDCHGERAAGIIRGLLASGGSNAYTIHKNGQKKMIYQTAYTGEDGSVAGPRVLEHMVDTVLYFEGDRQVAYRILRSVKNRFGSTNEIGVFEMRDKGLDEVKNPSQAMLNGRPTDASGSVVVCSIEGTRPILIEIQALVTKTNFGLPRRTSVGIDYNRVNLLMAVLEKRAGLRLGDWDAYVNLAGGMRLGEPAIDLGIVMAIASSYKNKVVDEGLLIFGEVGLSGEIRGVSMAEQRVREAEKLGFTACLMPKANLDSIQGKYQIRLIGASNIKEAMEYI